jgi:hypothetical protein
VSKYRVIVKYKERAPVKFYEFDRVDLALRSVASLARELREFSGRSWNIWIETEEGAHEHRRTR